MTEECLERDCLDDPCAGCASDGGPGTDGRYYPPELQGEYWFLWSSSEVEDIPANGWTVHFTTALVGQNNETSYIHARCVQ